MAGSNENLPILMLTPFDWVGLIITCIFIGCYFYYKFRGKHWKDCLDEICCSIMLIIMIFNATMLLAVARAEEDVWADPFAVALFLPVIIMAGFILICTGIAHLTKNMKWLNSRRDQYIAKVELLRDLSDPHKKSLADLLRKTMHIVFFFAVFILILLTAYFTRILQPWTLSQFQALVWEIRPDLYYLHVWQYPEDYYLIGRLHVTLFFLCYVCAIVAMWLDLIRFSTRFWCIGRNSIFCFSRPAELAKMPSFVPFFLAIGFAAVFIPPIPVLAIMVVMIFADTAASQIGIRLGRHKISFNPHKTWEGTIAGSIVAFIAALFVGPIWGIVAVGGFIFVDLLTDKIIPISDNLFTPICLGLFFFCIAVAGITYMPPSFLFF